MLKAGGRRLMPRAVRSTKSKAGKKKVDTQGGRRSEGRCKKVDAQGRAIDEVKTGKKKLTPKAGDRRVKAGARRLMPKAVRSTKSRRARRRLMPRAVRSTK